MKTQNKKTSIINVTGGKNLNKSSSESRMLKKRDGKNNHKPKMYNKVRELLSGVKTRLSDEIISGRN